MKIHVHRLRERNHRAVCASARLPRGPLSGGRVGSRGWDGIAWEGAGRAALGPGGSHSLDSSAKRAPARWGTVAE